ncbi:hypothetical protein ACWH4V_19830 [Bacillus mojavensis]
MFYHVTHSSRVSSILEKGLIPEQKNQFTLSMNSTLERYLGNSPIINVRNNGIFLYSKKPKDLRNLKDKDYRILEIVIDNSENIFCADSQHIDPIMKGIVHLLSGGTYDESRRDIFLSDEEMNIQATKYANSWSNWSPAVEDGFSNPEIIYAGKILPSKITVLTK